MPPGCDHAVHVQLEVKKRLRYFIVEFNEVQDVLRIKERKQSQPPQSGVYDVSWWVASSHPLGTGDTLPKRIIAAARAKVRAEDASFYATP